MRRLCTLLLLIPCLAAAASQASAAVRHQAVVLGANTTGITESTGLSLDRFTAEVGRPPGIAMYYRDWNESYRHALVSPTYFDPIVARGGVPMVTWLPRPGSADPIDQPDYSAAAIAAGSHDAFIRLAARESAAYGGPFFVRLAHEMNGPWSSWGAWVNGNTPAAYIEMWRHIVSIFREEGATNVRWVWSPNVYFPKTHFAAGGALPFRRFYPGDEWVDFVGLDGFNWGGVGRHPWRGFSTIFRPSYDALTHLSSKPVMIAETASAGEGGAKASWIRKIPEVLQSELPRVRALIWFDRDKEADWRIDSSPASLEAFRHMADSPRMTGSVYRLLALGEGGSK